MQTIEVRISLTDIMLQELLWRALLPEASVRMPSFKEAVQQHQARAGLSQENAQVSGVSVVIEQDKVYGEITYTTGGEEAGT